MGSTSKALILLSIALLTGCTKVSERAGINGSRHSWTEPGVLRIAVIQDVKTLNPLLASTTVEGLVDRLMFEPLISADTQGNPYPILAAAVPSVSNGGISKDGLTITYHLRTDARWSDGVPVTSEDVRWSYSAIMNPNNNVISRHGYDMIRDVTTPDAHTVVVHLKQRFAPFVNTFFAESDQPFNVVPAHVLSKYDTINQIPFNTRPVVSDGPFHFVEWVHGDHITVAANRDFFLGAPKLREIQIQAIPDENTTLRLLRTHTIDFMHQASIDTYPQAKNIDGIKTYWNNMNGYQSVEFNLTHPPLNDIRVRRAIVSAIDKAELIRTLTYGQEHLATEDIPDFMWAFDPKARPPSYDPQRADTLLKAAGFPMGRDGIRSRDGVPLRLLLVSDVADVTHRKMVVLIQNMLRRVGIDTIIKLYPFDLLYAARGMGGIMHSGKFDLITSPWYAGIDPDDASQWLCRNVPPEGYNDSHYCTPEMEAAQNEASTSYDLAVRKRAYAKIEELLARDNPQVFFYWQRQAELISVDFKGFAPNPVTESWNAWQWSI